MGAPFVVSRQGSEFLVNTTTEDNQVAPTITGLTNGGFVVTWYDTSGQGGDAIGASIKAQIYNAAGGRVGSEFLVKTATAGNQSEPAVAGLSDGGFVISWTDGSGVGGDTSSVGIKAQVFSAAGATVGAEFLVNTTTSGNQLAPTITGLNNGGFVVAWWDMSALGADTSLYSVKAQIYGARGAKVGAEFLVNTTTADNQLAPAITSLTNGGFVVTWYDTSGQGGDASSSSVKAQIYGAAGAKVGGEFIVNTVTAGSQLYPTTAGLTNGGFVVTWRDDSGVGGDASRYGIKAQIFDAAGAKIGAEFLVNTAVENDQLYSTVTGLTNGGFVITWYDYSGQGGDADSASVKAQAYDATGAKVGGEFLVNTATGGNQSDPSITGLRNGSFVISWTDRSDASGSNVKAQVYALNQAPVVTAPDALVSSGDDGRIVFSAARNTKLAVSDDGASLTTTLDVAHGTLKLAGSAGLTVAGDGTGHLVVTGTAAETNAALSGLVYQAATGYGGSDSLSLTTSDGALSTTAAVALSDRAALPHGYVASGGEFLVNTATSNNQITPTVTGLTNGGFVITWQDISGQGGDASGYGIKAQLYDAAGAKVGNEFLVNTTTSGYQITPTVTGLTNGSFVVSWEDGSGQGGDASGGIKAQIYGAAGAKVGSEFLVNTTIANSQQIPTITGLTSGGFVVTWMDYSGQNGDASATGIKAQVYNVAGAKVGGEFLVNTTTVNQQINSTITGLTNGGFVVSWQDYSGQGGDPSDSSIKAQVYDAMGAKVGGEFLVNTVTANAQSNPTITGLTNGGFVVSWEDLSGQGVDTSGSGIKGQVYALDQTGSLTLAGLQDGHAVEDHTITATLSDPEGVAPGVTYTFKAAAAVLQSGASNTYAPGDADVGKAITVTAAYTDGAGHAASLNATATSTLNVNDAPTFTSGVNRIQQFEDSGPLAAVFATVISAGPANETEQTVQFVVTNDNNALFSIQPTISSSGVLTYTAAPNAYGNATVTVVLKDNGGTDNGGRDTSAPRTFTIQITPKNDAPSGADKTIATPEDSAHTFTAADFGFGDPTDAGTAVNALAALVIATLPAAGSLTNGGAAVAVGQVIPVADLNAGLLKFTPAADANRAGYTSFTFQVRDDGGTVAGGIDTDPTPNTITLDVTPVNDAPVLTSDGAATVVENTTGPVYRATATDVDDAAATFRYALSGGADRDLFTIDAATGAVSFRAAPDYEAPDDAGADHVYEIEVTANDGRLDSTAKAVRIIVADANDVAPAFTSSAAPTLAENTRAVVTLASTDPDTVGGPATYTISGGADATRFQVVDGNQLQFVAAPDYEAKGSAAGTNAYAVQVTASDGVNTTVQTLSVTVTDANDNAPAIVSDGAASVAENTAASTVVYGAQAVDADASAPNNLVRYALGGADAGLFTIDATTGEVRFKAAPDYEAPSDAGGDNVYDVVVTATDGGNPALAASKAVAITVTGVNDIAPVLSGDGAIAVLQGGTTALTTADLSASDADTAPAGLAYAVTATTHGTVLVGGQAAAGFT